MFLRISVTLATWALVDAVRDEIFQARRGKGNRCRLVGGSEGGDLGVKIDMDRYHEGRQWNLAAHGFHFSLEHVL